MRNKKNHSHSHSQKAILLLLICVCLVYSIYITKLIFQTAIVGGNNAASDSRILSEKDTRVQVQVGQNQQNTGQNNDQEKRPVPGFVADLSSADLSNLDLRYRNFAHTNLRNANFSSTIRISAQGSSTMYIPGNVFGADFSYSDLSNTLFMGEPIFKSSPIVLNAQYTNFKNANLSGNQNIKNVDFRNASFVDANLSNSKITGIADFTNANLTNTNLSNAHLDTVIFFHAILDRSNLTGAVMNNVICPDGTNSDSNGNSCANHLTF